jgi:hypothetical protein
MVNIVLFYLFIYVSLFHSLISLPIVLSFVDRKVKFRYVSNFFPTATISHSSLTYRQTGNHFICKYIKMTIFLLVRKLVFYLLN